MRASGFCVQTLVKEGKEVRMRCDHAVYYSGRVYAILYLCVYFGDHSDEQKLKTALTCCACPEWSIRLVALPVLLIRCRCWATSRPYRLRRLKGFPCWREVVPLFLIEPIALWRILPPSSYYPNDGHVVHMLYATYYSYWLVPKPKVQLMRATIQF